MFGKAYRGYGTKDWHTPTFRLILGFVVGWVGSAIFEPTNPLVQLRNFYWFAYTQGTTVGFGDFFPKTFGGRVSAMFMGVMTIYAIGKYISIAGERRRGRERKRLEGRLKLDPKDIKHQLVVVFGYDRTGKSRTEKIVEQVLHGNGHQIVLCEQQGDLPNPLMTYDQTRTHYITTKQMVSDLCMTEVCVSLAKSVIINVPNPFQAFAIARAIRAASPNAHIVVALENKAEDEGFRDLEGVVCLNVDEPIAVAREARAPYTANLMNELLDSEGLAMNIFEIGTALGLGTLSYDRIRRFLDAHDASLTALLDPITRRPVLDPRHAVVRQGWRIAYVAPEEISSGSFLAGLLND